MKIPQVANRMREISEAIKDDYPDEASALVELADELKRRSPAGPRAPATSTPMTPELADEIREFATDNPSMSHQEIGTVFNANHGRVSEAHSR